MTAIPKEKREILSEVPFVLDTADGFKIYGRITHGSNPNGKLLVLCHGLMAHMNIHQFQTGKRYFAARGYDVVRFNFYDEEESSRTIMDANTEIHAEDLKTVLAHFTPPYQKTYVAGHSYGGLTILRAAPENVAAVSFWDSSFSDTEEMHDPWAPLCEYVEELQTYMMMWKPVPKVIGNKMIDERKEFKRATLDGWAQNFPVPAQVIGAGAFGFNVPFQKRLFEKLGSEKECHIIDGATHSFVEGDAVFELLDKTCEWFEKY